MGDPKKFRKKYSTPSHPWQKARIDQEKELMQTYGLRNKKEVWKMFTILKNYYTEAKRLVALNTKQSEKEKEQLIGKLQSLGLLKPGADIHNVLEITINDLMERRLQTILMRKSLARSANQSRQMITHGHVLIKGKKIDSPSYLVTENELTLIQFNQKSAFSDDEHPERVLLEKKENDEEQEGKSKE
jgi:small subunit ribosomal protein S4